MRLIVIVFILLFSSPLLSQKKYFFDNYGVETRLMYGSIFDHRQSMSYCINEPVSAFQINFTKQTDGTERWHQFYKFPTVGFGYYHGNLGNAEKIGKADALYGFANLPQVKNRYFSVNFNFSIGLAYISKHFDIDDNVYNTAIGSNINGYYNISYDIKSKIHEKLELITGLGLTHYSNGKMQVPNLGLNILSVRVGLKYQQNEQFRIINYETDSINNKNNYTLLYSIGLREIDKPGGNKYFITSLSGNYTRTLNGKNRIGGGFDLFYDGALAKKYNDYETKYNQFDLTYYGVNLTYHRLYGKTTVLVQSGFYLYSNYEHDGFVYQRWGFNYHLTKNLLLNLSFKSYFAKAEFVEWGIGYYWN